MHKSENETELTLKAFAYQKKTLKERQGQPSEYKEIFAKEETHKEFISKTYKQPVQLNIKNTYKPRKKKGGQRLKWMFLQGKLTESRQVHEKMLSITNDERN